MDNISKGELPKFTKITDEDKEKIKTLVKKMVQISLDSYKIQRLSSDYGKCFSYGDENFIHAAIIRKARSNIYDEYSEKRSLARRYYSKFQSNTREANEILEKFGVICPKTMELDFSTQIARGDRDFSIKNDRWTDNISYANEQINDIIDKIDNLYDKYIKKLEDLISR